MIPMRCVHCGTGLEAWDRTNLLWGACNDCRAWEAYLWHQRQVQHVDAAQRWAADAIRKALKPYQGGKAV